ncbi:MAG: twin-arginine translocase subunit TatC [Acidimicrobiales bacterium]|nr:twin-arginine translocase subunit TatC [Acidimicrobiales bacterium]
MTTTSDPLDSGRMSLVEHLTELRNRIIKAVLAVAVGAVVCWIVYNPILDFLLEPYCDINPGSCDLIVTDPLESFSVRMTVAGYGGIALAMPVLLWQVWRFIAPGLYPHERKYASLFTALGVILFALGAGLAYYSLPRALDFLVEVGGGNLVTLYRADRYLSFVVKMMLAFGVGFEFPLVLVFLQMMGLVHYSSLGRQRRYALVGIVVLVAVLTPSGDPFTLLLLSVPMYLFYEASIAYGWIRERRRRRRERAEAGA